MRARTLACMRAHTHTHSLRHAPGMLVQALPPPKESYLHVLRLLHEGVLHGVIVTSGC